MSEAFDYVIVGAGTAGCVLANRLSADAGATVALIEAGPPDDDPAIRVPAMVAKAIGNPRQSWGYQTVPQRHVDDRELPVPRGRVLGGCSSINGMVYFRGHPREYDEWQQPGWAYADLQPYFERLENYEAAHTPQRHRGGPVNVIDIPKPNPLVGRFLAAADTLGLPRCADFNGGDPEGFGPRQAAIRNGRRESGVTAYLNPARRRPNLKIVTDAPVTRVVFEGRRATGVEIGQGGARRSGARRIVAARREVILSCGAYGSPQLLQLSGIGDAAALKALGVAPLIDLPAVGRNLQDHPAASIAVRTANTESYGLSWRTVPRSALIAARYLLFRSGPLASNVFEANGFMRSRPQIDRPDLQIIFMPAHRNANGHWLPRGHGYGIIFVNLRPASRGSVMLTSKDPRDKPAIDFNFLSAPGDIDVLVRGFEVARSILSAPPFAALKGRETAPGPGVRERGQIEAHIRKSLVTVHHPCGTCRLGDVVDTSLRVKGAGALRVVDASVIPTVISGNSNIPVNAVAERAADLILEKIR
jgi:choline dehydrogenase-like flavoprotein